MNWKRMIYLLMGLISLFFAGIGAVLPILPCFPFLMISVFCFGKSSKKLQDWLTDTRLYQNNFKDFAEKKEMTKKTKTRVILSVTAVMIPGFILMKNVPIGRFVLVIVWIFHILYFTCGVKTKKDGTLGKAI